MEIIYASCVRCELLIEPYGIETGCRAAWRDQACLLIEPFGIETKDGSTRFIGVSSFNRTFWN